ncbi:SAM-dependent methyltransferase [Streptomyces sp. HNM0574]|uniref:SAM-dependent methyltransferase n=1 Tax=Streptomyces sp. HNM0574 TaxID=2714954 RepID=UPI00146F077B|nr:SAM-dependent methyltransferase [Streptomyces sp. HNM0574]NLU67992.1 SAM-dependent methyltransferase [Streptomyces sp. HNM0574]
MSYIGGQNGNGLSPEIDDELGLNRPHTARMYDYFLGGSINYHVDRETAVATLQAYPNATVAARQNRAFMHRAVRCLSREHGITQFLDIGTGVPTEPNLHQVAQAEHPAARVVYTDNDPIVLTYARALLTSSREGSTDYIEADVRDPERILEHARTKLDFSKPIAVSVIALFHFLADPDDPFGIVRTLLAELPAGSALALSHATCDFDPEMQKIADTYNARGVTTQFRDGEEIKGFFDGLELIDPGLTATCDWRPELAADGMALLPGMVAAADVGVYAGVGIKR